ncbi:hypothetical protein [Aureibacter tunicatorum]|uniref:Uncharacterized protein n=1 Tax=Aureibacter tunicatorum TaxID=866807 RepID=A0AAE3XR69_9BACT|nr:hypothetical protein [Aureibacter tunicatorum]MDR6241175.1 hypothetical protein [Aureibacter tunicatorum]BDD03950.1 hypothetical protein AUTU_14330 [Aureibacter tunicatorum]
MKYRIITSLTLTGKMRHIDLGDFAYGEWIIYENRLPRFHIDCFRENSDADSLINSLLKSKNWTIEKILDKINQTENRNLTLGYKTPFIEFELSSELQEIKLNTLPMDWIKKLENN